MQPRPGSARPDPRPASRAESWRRSRHRMRAAGRWSARHRQEGSGRPTPSRCRDARASVRPAPSASRAERSRPTGRSRAQRRHKALQRRGRTLPELPQPRPGAPTASSQARREDRDENRDDRGVDTEARHAQPQRADHLVDQAAEAGGDEVAKRVRSTGLLRRPEAGPAVARGESRHPGHLRHRRADRGEKPSTSAALVAELVIERTSRIAWLQK